MDRFDVAVVGAGPAGSSSAVSLARRGYSVILLERALFPREKLCGDFLNPANWELFEHLGVADKLLSLEHEKVTAFRISTFSGADATISFPSRNGKTIAGFGLRRSALDDLLLRQAEKEGVVVKQGRKVRALIREAAGWCVMVGGEPESEKVSSTFLIGADGRNSWVAHRLGLARTSESPGHYVAFQLHLKGVRGLQGDVQIHVFPGGYAGLVGLGGGTANLCFTVERREIKQGISLEALFENRLYKNSFLRQSLAGSEIASKVRAASPLYFPPRRCNGEGYLLVGDAARVTEPVTGEGVYFALKSGILAAATIDLAFKRGDRSSEQLASYSRLCQEAFSLRQRVNRIIRALVYRPFLLAPVIRLSARTSLPLRPLVDQVCGAVRFPR
ncbi:MAG: NAD(P)/FAD-dependent oxidoreductase [Deltaproteobacteria bacterium]|nr:NAD(P)/FAD-dependent oxidoreductase [Deltaproteobacteria bacterium]